MRLHKHAELVERMARAIYDNPQYRLLSKLQIREPLNLPPFDKTGPDVKEAYRGYATAALDALLEAAVELGVGEVGIPDTVTWFAKTAEPALILRMEATDDA